MATFVHRGKLEADSTEIYQLQLRAPQVTTNHKGFSLQLPAVLVEMMKILTSLEKITLLL